MKYLVGSSPRPELILTTKVCASHKEATDLAKALAAKSPNKLYRVYVEVEQYQGIVTVERTVVE